MTVYLDYGGPYGHELCGVYMSCYMNYVKCLEKVTYLQVCQNVGIDFPLVKVFSVTMHWDNGGTYGHNFFGVSNLKELLT